MSGSTPIGCVVTASEYWASSGFSVRRVAMRTVTGDGSLMTFSNSTPKRSSERSTASDRSGTSRTSARPFPFPTTRPGAVDRAHGGGRERLLTADDPALYFTSSGTTGAHKKIPVTPRFVQTVFMPFYYAMWAPMVEHFWDVVARPGAVLNLKQDILTAPRTTASGRPHLGASQVDFGAVFGETLAAEPGTSAPWAELPSAVPEDDHWRGNICGCDLPRRTGTSRCIVAFNPAMIAALPHQLRHWWPRILKEIRDGTLGGSPHAPPNPRRAAELERLAQYHPRSVPPWCGREIKVMLSWTTGVASLYLPRVREEFGADVTLLPAPVGASEGPVGVALDRHWLRGQPCRDRGRARIRGRRHRPRPGQRRRCSPTKLEADRDYHVVFSHAGGLYRYAVGDVVRVVDRRGGVPRMEYAGRATLSDAVGERLREGQVDQGTPHRARRHRPRNYATRRAGWRLPTLRLRYYTFAVATLGAWSEYETSRFARLLDGALCDESAGYRRARAEERLGDAVRPDPAPRCLPEPVGRHGGRVVSGSRRSRTGCSGRTAPSGGN